MMNLYTRLGVLIAATAPGLLAQSAQSDLFLKEVRPLIESNCLGCHNRKIRMSGLSLESRKDLLDGGKRGVVVIPGKPAESRLLSAVRHDGNLKMPPARMLSKRDIATVEKWIAAGAVWTEDGRNTPLPRPNHWSFLTPKEHPLPPVKRTEWVRSPIDRFILARLEKEGVNPSPEAAKETLIRRVYLDVIGLLPSPEQIEEFKKDSRPDAWERVVDGLLASRHYGERWGRHWLDQARYADSDGGSRDEPRQVWRYRDWIIDSLNADQPFDDFVIEQLAGDLLPNPTQGQLIATGFHRNTPIQIEAGTDREQYRVEAVFDRVDTTGTVFLGLTVGCARCHDHKYDPISHRDYYQLFAFFNNSDDWDNDRPQFNPKAGNLHDVHRPLLEFATAEEIARRDEIVKRMLRLDKEIEAYLNGKNPLPEDAYIKSRNAEIAELKRSLPKIESAMIMRELPVPRETHIFHGGDFLSKGERVVPGAPSFLHPPGVGMSNRLDFARWLVDPANPLLARVTVNRTWQQYFGKGLVETENDFGTQGSPPTHAELLDWLATEFIQKGWSRKAIHRLILTSATYRQSSKVREDLKEKDPGNHLLAGQTRLRLEAEIVRDAGLSASGLLAPKIGGPSVFPPQPAKAMEASQVKKTWTASTGPDRYRRGMYTFFWRVTPHPALVVFDSPNGMVACTRRTRSNTPLQALALLNDTAFHEFAQAFAMRILRETPQGTERQIRRAFQIALARNPTTAELDRVHSLFATELDELHRKRDDIDKLLPADAGGRNDRVELAAWTSVARVLLSTDEFITRE